MQKPLSSFVRLSPPILQCAVLAVLGALLLPLAGEADTIVFDFESGPGPLFTPFDEGNIWDIDLDGPELRVSKPADDGTIEPYGTRGGVYSTFQLAGDFTITVDYRVYTLDADLTDPTLQWLELRADEILLTGDGDTDTRFTVSRFREQASQEIEAFAWPPGAIGRQTAPPEMLNDGRLRIQRVGSTISGFYAPLGSDSFTAFGSYGGFDLPMFIVLFASQGTGCVCPGRANVAIDMAFDNLVVEGADLPVLTSGVSWSRLKNMH